MNKQTIRVAQSHTYTLVCLLSVRVVFTMKMLERDDDTIHTITTYKKIKQFTAGFFHSFSLSLSPSSALLVAIIINLYEHLALCTYVICVPQI